MNQLRLAIACLGIGLVASLVIPSMDASPFDKKTVITINQEIELPGGVVLQPGTYVMKLVDSQTTRHIVQFLNEAEDEVLQTTIAFPNYRLEPEGDTVITFYEVPAGQPEPIRAWFYPGDNFGQEFAYPEERATALATTSGLTVPTAETSEAEEIMFTSPAETEVTEARPAPEPVEQEPFEQTAVEPEPVEQEPIEQFPAEPEAETQAAAPTFEEEEPVTELPQTASSLPLAILIGAFCLVAALLLGGVIRARS